jgi:hypothetical protein
MPLRSDNSMLPAKLNIHSRMDYIKSLPEMNPVRRSESFADWMEITDNPEIDSVIRHSSFLQATFRHYRKTELAPILNRITAYLGFSRVELINAIFGYIPLSSSLHGRTTFFLHVATDDNYTGSLYLSTLLKAGSPKPPREPNPKIPLEYLLNISEILEAALCEAFQNEVSYKWTRKSHRLFDIYDCPIPGRNWRSALGNFVQLRKVRRS